MRTLLTIALFVTAPHVAFAFSDVSSLHRYVGSINYVRDQGIVQGYSDGSFRPDANINRAELTKVMVEARFTEEQIATCDVSTLVFSDIDQTAWYAPYVCTAFLEQWIVGYDDGTFKPGATINAAETAKILSQAYQVEVEVADVWYQGYIDTLIDRAAYPVTIAEPGQLVNRGEVAFMIQGLDEEGGGVKSGERRGESGESGVKSGELREESGESGVESEDDGCELDEIDVSGDLSAIRSHWLQVVNQYRVAYGLPAYESNAVLDHTATVWALRSREAGLIEHKRLGSDDYYNYQSILDWFTSLGVKFSNPGGTLFTENIAYRIVECEDDCTSAINAMLDDVLASYIAEKGRESSPHYNSVVHEQFTQMGLGLAYDEAEEFLYVVVHYAVGVEGAVESCV